MTVTHSSRKLGQRVWPLIALLLGGCGGSISDPPVAIQEEARAAIEQAEKNTQRNGSTPRIEPALGVMATSPRIRTREEYSEYETASDALARIGQPAVPEVTTMLHDSDPQVRIRAAEILARIGPPASAAVPELVAMLNDQDREVRKQAARALGQIGPAAAPAVPELLRAAARETR